MRSKRLLTMLLALVMVLSAVSPAVSATTVSSDSLIGAQKGAEKSEAKTEASPFENDRLASAENAGGTLNLRENAAYIPNVEEVQTTDAKGSWVITPADGSMPNVSIEHAETPDSIKELKEASKLYQDTDMVNAFVVMEDEPLAETYSSVFKVDWNREEALLKIQNSIIEMIEKYILKGEKLDVRYQFTYLTNAFSIATEFGKLTEIAQMDGVKSVYLMPVYTPCTTAAPNATSSGVMTGVPTVWEKLAYRGEGMKIAVIDTGLDMDHPSFAQHSDFATTDSSLTVEKIDAVLEDLNAYALRGTITGKTLYRSAKVPYAFNYVDESLTADHSNDMQGDHGTHVAGIAAANDNTPGTDVVGMAPEAQIVVMKVFGANGGAYTDDIIAALEDAMTLGCDVANLSLGACAGFTSENEEIDAIYDRIAEQEMVVCISAGNEGTSSYSNMWGTNMNTTSNPDVAAVGSPGTYANVTTVASVDNAVVMTPYFSVGEQKVFYMDPYEYQVALPDIIESFGDTFEYVIIDGLGEEADFYDEEGNSLVEGKVAVIKRGETSFASKIFNAEYAGAVAALIWNNTEDDIFSFGMQISEDGQNYPWIPAALITVSDGQMMADQEEKVLTLSTKPGERASAAGGQMSSFSSWGMAPDLTLEPDISGVGGNIYSCYDGGNYGLMSGTSMSCPQVAGVTALVKQYLKAEFPDADGKEIRAMAEALMMSNAEVVISADSGLEASPRQQGAGLVNAASAVTSGAYLTVDGDKPKVSMGDSANGTFSFSFEIHNISDEVKIYTLDSSLLTEAVAGMQLSETEVEYFMYGVEQALSGTVSFDKQFVTVAPGKTATVKVSIALSEEDKQFFAAAYPNGGYVEGYIYLQSLDSDSLNLPFLGFYGDWTEPPVFDTAYWYDNSFWGAAPVNGIPEGNEYYHVMWTSLGGTDWVLGFNPYTGAMLDETGKVIYDPANNSVSPNGDGIVDSLTEIYLSLMRNAKTLTFTYTNAETGEVLSEEVITNARKTMYQSNYGQIVPWIYSWYGTSLYNFTDANGAYLANDTKVLLTISAKADYADGGEHVIQVPITVDTQAPEMMMDLHYTYEGNKLTLMATDNVALAGAIIMNKSGTQIWAEQFDFTEITDGMYQVDFDVTGLGTEFLVVLGDYAGNESAFYVSYDNDQAGDNLPEVDTSRLYGYRVFDDHIYSDHMYGWISMDKALAEGDNALISVHTDDYLEYAAINAAEYVDGKIFAVDAVHNLVVMAPGLWDRTTLVNLGVNVLDMTFDDSTDTMYVLTKDDSNVYLNSMDILTGELTVLYDYGYYTSAPYAIADDDNGTLYVVKYQSSGLYILNEAYEAVAITDAEGNAIVINDSTGSATSPNYAQSLAYENGILYWVYFKNLYNGYYVSSELICINVADMSIQYHPYVSYAYDAEGNLVEYYPMTEIVGLITLTETDYKIPAAEALKGLWMEEERVILNVGDTTAVRANPIPWNYEVESLTWTSSNPAVATVAEDGTVTAVAKGSATITAVSGDASVSCVVTVVDISGSFTAYDYYSADGNSGYMISVDLATMDGKLLGASPVDFVAADYNGHDGCYYGYTENGQFWRYDPSKSEATKLGAPIGITPLDMAYDYSTGMMYAATLDYNTYVGTIHAVSLTTGQLQPMAQVEGLLPMTLACSTEGVLYTITAFGELYELNFATGEMNLLMDGLGELQYMQSMCYDHVNDVLLWNYVEASQICWINPDLEDPYILYLGDPTESGLFEFVGMYTVPAQIPEKAPVAVESVSASDMTMLVGTTKTASAAVLPFNATCQNLTLTSDNAAIVTVNADGTLTAVAEGYAQIQYVLTDTVSGQNFEGSFIVTVLHGADDIYGHVMTDLASMAGQFWTRIYSIDPANPDMLESTEYIIYSEEYYDGKLYAFGYDPNDWESNWQMFVMDPVTHAVESMTDLGEGCPFIYDVTYDYATSTMYAVAGPSDTASDIYVVDIRTGELILLKQTEEFFMSIAATDHGIYLMEPSVGTSDEFDPWAPVVYSNATLYSFDPITKTTQVVGDTGMKSNMLSSMSYDYDTGYLYWTPLYQEASYISNLAIVDTETGAATALGTLGSAGAQVSGLYILSENFPEEAAPALNDVLMVPGKASVSEGMRLQMNLYVLPLGLDAQIAWSSSDENIATVDEEGIVYGIAQGKTIITAAVTYGDKTLSASCEVSVLGEDASFLTYNKTTGGFAAINRGDMTQVAALTTGESAAAVSAMTNMGDAVYGYDVENGFFKLDTTTFKRTAIGTPDSQALIAAYMMDNYGYTEEQVAAEIDLYAFEVRDLAYDAAGNRLLALGNVYDKEWGELNYGNSIYEVDLQTGALKLLYTFQDIYYVMAIAADNDGNVYYYNAYNDYYTRLDLATGQALNLVSLQTQSYYGDYLSSHSLYFDELTGMLYHLFTSNGSFYMMFCVDPVSGALELACEGVGEVIYDDMSGSYIADSYAGLCFVDVEVTEEEENDNIIRLFGNDRVETAIKVADELKKVLGKDSFDAIILANGDNFADALTGSYLAAAKDAPILLYRENGIAMNEAYIQNNLAENGTVYILGGDTAVPASVEESLVSAGHNVVRLSGETRFETNLEILDAAGVADEEILICTGWEYADSLSASAAGLPVLMVNTTTQTLTDAQIAFLTEHADNDYTIIGGTNAVSEELEAAVEAIVGEVDRVSGATREETSVAVAQRFFDAPAYVFVAFSRNFPDGLCAGPLAQAMNAPLLLTNVGNEEPAAEYIAANGIVNGYVMGGSSVLSDETVAIVFDQN